MTNMSFTSRADFQDIATINFYQEALKHGTVTDDLFEKLAAGTRDNARTPMQWDSSEKGGFTTGVPWFPVNPNTSEINVDAAMADEHSVFHHYRKLIALRHDLPVVALGNFNMLLEWDPHIYAFTRSLNGVELLVLGNFSAKELPVDLPDGDAWAGAELLLGNYNEVSADAPSIVLQPWEARIYRREQGETGNAS